MSKDKFVAKVQKLDQHCAPHRDQGKTVLVSTVKAIQDIRREKKAK